MSSGPSCPKEISKLADKAAEDSSVRSLAGSCRMLAQKPAASDSQEPQEKLQMWVEALVHPERDG